MRDIIDQIQVPSSSVTQLIRIEHR